MSFLAAGLAGWEGAEAEKSSEKSSFAVVGAAAAGLGALGFGAGGGMDGLRVCVLERRVWAAREPEAEGLWEIVGVVATGGAGRAEVLGAACGGDAGVATGASVCACPVRSEGTLHGRSQNTCSAAPSSTDGSSGSGPSIAHRRDSYLERINESILL
jgi:hypothetical protein